MNTQLAKLRQFAPSCTPEQYLKSHPSCWIVYTDDSPTADPAKVEAERMYERYHAVEKQRRLFGVFYTLQAFESAPTPQEFLCFRHLGVTVNLVRPEEFRTLRTAAIESRKETYLAQRLRPFPIQPHYLCETLTGFDLVYRVMPARHWPAVGEGIALNARLVTALAGDFASFGLTQSFRVPGTLDLRRADEPFECRWLRDLSGENPYSWDEIRKTLLSGTNAAMQCINETNVSIHSHF